MCPAWLPSWLCFREACAEACNLCTSARKCLSLIIQIRAGRKPAKVRVALLRKVVLELRTLGGVMHVLNGMLAAVFQEPCLPSGEQSERQPLFCR